MIVVASPSYIIRKGLSEILKELYSGRKIIGVESVVELNSLIAQNKIALLLASAEMLSNPKLTSVKGQNVLKLINTRPEFLESSPHQTDFLYLDDSENSILHTLKRNLALMDKNGNLGKSEMGLSDRELDIVREVALGKTNKEIADNLFISTHTVITHRKNITRKLGIKTVSGLTVYALLNKLIKMSDGL